MRATLPETTKASTCDTMNSFGSNWKCRKKAESHANQVEDGELIPVEIKQEGDIKLEPDATGDVLMITRPRHVSVSVNADSVDENDDLNVEDLYATDVKPEPKSKAEFDSNVELKPKVGKQSDENDPSNESAEAERQSNKGDVASKSSNRKSKKKDIGLKGRAKAVINAAHRKQFAAKKAKKQHKCSLCDYVTSNLSHLKVHMFTHTGEKPFLCNICNKRFTQISHLRTHLKTHTDEYPFSCSICLKRFAQNDERSKHEANCNGRRLECHLCQKFSTSDKHQLKRHMRIHTGNRPFRCNFCLKRFARKDNLKMHLKIHTNSRPMKFQCLVCARNFSQEVEKNQHEMKCKRRRYECYLCKSYLTFLKQHMMVHMLIHHTGTKPFQCEMCKKCFTQKFELKQHQKRNHK